MTNITIEELQQFYNVKTPEELHDIAVIKNIEAHLKIEEAENIKLNCTNNDNLIKRITQYQSIQTLLNDGRKELNQSVIILHTLGYLTDTKS